LLTLQCPAGKTISISEDMNPRYIFTNGQNVENQNCDPFLNPSSTLRYQYNENTTVDAYSNLSGCNGKSSCQVTVPAISAFVGVPNLPSECTGSGQQVQMIATYDCVPST